MPLHVILRRQLSSLFGAFCLGPLLVALAGCDTVPGPPPAGPSVLLVVVDTLRADHVGAVRRDDDRGTAATPLLDRWAEGAVRFRSARSPAPFTMPAMAAVLAGVYPDRAGVAAHEPGTTLRSWRGDTLAEAAARAGMRTMAVVANPWLARTTTGFERGFEEFVRLYQAEQPPGASGAAAVTSETIRLLDAAGGRRTFVWAHYFDPHMPYTPPQDLAGEAAASPSRVMRDFDAKNRDLAAIYRGEGYSAAELAQARRLYEGEVRYVDREVARLLDHLERSGRARDTIVVVASDHGESLGEHGLYFAHDYTLYDELLRVPLLVKVPGRAPGTRDEEVSLLDIAPTLCRVAALPCRNGFDGRDLFAASPPPRTLFAASTPLRKRSAPWPRLEVPGPGGRWTMALAGRKKIVRIPGRNGIAWESYDLATDPHEKIDGGGNERGQLAADLDQWLREMDAARPASPPPPSREQQARDDESLRSLGYLD